MIARSVIETSERSITEFFSAVGGTVHVARGTSRPRQPSHRTGPIRRTGVACSVRREIQAMPPRLALLVLLGCFWPRSAALHAQRSVGASLTITPSVGMAVIGDNGHLASGGMSAIVEIDLQGTSLRWGVSAAVRGIGIWCSDGCDLGGHAVGAGISYLLGAIGVGGGVGLLHRSAGWLVQPHGQLSLVRGRLRLQLRLEVPEGVDRVHILLLFGLQVPVGGGG